MSKKKKQEPVKMVEPLTGEVISTTMSPEAHKQQIQTRLGQLIDAMNDAKADDLVATFNVSLGADNKYVVGSFTLTKTF